MYKSCTQGKFKVHILHSGTKDSQEEYHKIFIPPAFLSIFTAEKLGVELGIADEFSVVLSCTCSSKHRLIICLKTIKSTSLSLSKRFSMLSSYFDSIGISGV